MDPQYPISTRLRAIKCNVKAHAKYQTQHSFTASHTALDHFLDSLPQKNFFKSITLISDSLLSLLKSLTMQVKRARVAHSASFDEAGLLGILNHSSTAQPAELRRAPKNPPPSPKRERPPSGILKVSSPELLRESGCGYGHAHGQGQSGNFLERCYVCKKKMLERDVFMYGYGFISFIYVSDNLSIFCFLCSAAEK